MVDAKTWGTVIKWINIVGAYDRVYFNRNFSLLIIVIGVWAIISLKIFTNF